MPPGSGVPTFRSARKGTETEKVTACAEESGKKKTRAIRLRLSRGTGEK